MTESGLLSIRIFLVKVTLRTAQEKYLLSINEELDHGTGVDTSDLASKKLFCLKAENDKLDISKLINFPTSLNNFF